MKPRCPICRKAAGEKPVAPFCSERCRLIDLGRWLGGEYSVPSEDVVPPGGGGEGGVDEPDVAVGLRKVPPELE